MLGVNAVRLPDGDNSDEVRPVRIQAEGHIALPEEVEREFWASLRSSYLQQASALEREIEAKKQERAALLQAVAVMERRYNLGQKGVK